MHSTAALVDTASSKHARLRPVPIGAVTLHDGFWKHRIDANRTNGIPAFLAWLDRDDQTAPFRAYASGSGIDAAIETMRANYDGRNYHRLPHHWRANVLAWLEACAWALQSADDPAPRETLETFVRGVVSAHRDPRFLSAYYGDDYEHSYQLATPGHLIQAAIAHYRLAGDRSFLDCAMQVADDVLRKFTGGRYAEHPCIEMALVELYRTTGETRYLEGARHFLEPLLRQSPVIGPDEGEGDWRHFNRHVVRQTYLCTGGADYVLETGDEAFQSKLEAIWNDMTSAKMLITGQLAVDPVCPERVTSRPYELSTGVFGVLQGTSRTGCELCEAVGNAYWNWRMLAANGEAKYADQFERVMYNGLLSHVSFEGDRFDYLLALASDGDHPPRTIWGHPETGCCPPNALRFLASLPGYMFSTSADGVWVHLYDNCRVDLSSPDGRSVGFEVETQYPWEGRVALRLALPRVLDLAVYLRIPSWCRNASIKVNGRTVEQPMVAGSYCCLKRVWKDGDTIEVDLPMPAVGVQANPQALDYRNKLALMRGPLVYCYEGVDNPDVDVWNIGTPGDDARQAFGLYGSWDSSDQFCSTQEVDLLGGVVTLKRTIDDGRLCTAIPYYAWGNRGQHKMRVWLEREN